jgi:hypothetical protein
VQVQGDVIIGQGETTGANCWKALEQGWCKGNWDAAVDRESGRLGLSVVIWDTVGNVLVARCKMRRVYLSQATAEAKAALLTVQLCCEMGFSMVHLEGDAKGVVDMVNLGEADKSWLGHLIEDIKKELNSLAC